MGTVYTSAAKRAASNSSSTGRARGSGSTSSASSASSVHVDGGASHPPAAANHGSSPLRQVSGTPSLQLQTQQAQQTLMFTGPPSAAGAAFRTASPPGFEAALPVTTAAAPATTMAPVTSIQQHQLPAVTAPSYHPTPALTVCWRWCLSSACNARWPKAVSPSSSSASLRAFCNRPLPSSTARVFALVSVDCFCLVCFCSFLFFFPPC